MTDLRELRGILRREGEMRIGQRLARRLPENQHQIAYLLGVTADIPPNPGQINMRFLFRRRLFLCRNVIRRTRLSFRFPRRNA